MFTLPKTRFHFSGDEFIVAEISREMNAESNFKALAITNEVRNRNIPGVIEVYPANASYLVRYDPDVVSPYDLLDYLKDIDITKSDIGQLNFQSKMIEVPVWYDDPVSAEFSRRFSDRNPKDAADVTDFEYTMQLNGYRDKERFIEAHSKYPHLVTMLGFNPGLTWSYPLGPAKEEVIHALKYASPRTDTPKGALGIGGVFSVIYPLSSPGSYQLIGASAVPVYDQKQQLSDFKSSIILVRPGDLWKFKSVDEKEFVAIKKQVEEKSYRYKVKEVAFSAEDYVRSGRSYIENMMEGF
ncbi:5-oxoprolinase subunit B family protein [Fictibacillus fluitans]|uniref:Carboxyltransferase domain-containing protein n=1 Tax=Fictibacillus fluitans TaxID=3058422 RepID=A0ABT8HT09_9BACL|nr:carboxyltransferase domain-containing protein [Fictibacillus sp. NE201]MDN4523903.1 carboxyltransferase domain-containing protein [Fictibacillus sp. NE201]